MKKTFLIILSLVLAFSMFNSSASASSGVVIYDSISDPLPGNIPSVGFEATSTSEFGDEIRFTADTGRVLQSVTVIMSSWGCESGDWVSMDCVTTSGATFDHPITLNLYAVDTSGSIHSPGELLATLTQTFTIPYRPSADPVNCPTEPGKWYSDGACYNGLATPITFDFSALDVLLPDEIIWGVAFNTSHYGAEPIGVGASCYSELGGCGYDSLNVGVLTSDSIVGTDVDSAGAFLNSTWAGAYCDAGVGGTGTFRLDTGCWEGYRPQIRFEVQKMLGACQVNNDYSNKVYTLVSDCITDKTIFIEDGWTLNGNGYSITAIDPVDGHFLGAVIMNGGTTASVINLEVTASGLTNICDRGANRLRAILFDGAGGSITDNYVHGIRQGLSGCQEGNAIEVRNFDAADNPALDQVEVLISGNVVEDYQKNGITTNGNVAATVSNNTVTGDGQITYIAQNGIQIGYGATAFVRNNTISSNWYTPKSYISCGLLMYDANGVKQKDNIFISNERNLCNFMRGGGNFNLE